MGAVDLDRLVAFAAAALGAFGQDHAVALRPQCDRGHWRLDFAGAGEGRFIDRKARYELIEPPGMVGARVTGCLLYTSDAADE